MMTYFVVFTYCLVIKTYVFTIPLSNLNITNFKQVNLTELKNIIGPQADKILNPILDKLKPSRAKETVRLREASEEEQLPLPQVFRDDKKNLFFDLVVIRGRENRLMVGEEGQLCASVQSSPDVEDSLNMELWRFISSVLQIRRDEVEIVLSEEQEMARRVVVKGRAISERECQQRLHANLQPLRLEAVKGAGLEEAADIDRVYLHTEIRSKLPTGPAPAVSEEDIEHLPGPNYVKNPAILNKVLQDLMPNQEIIVRGRLLRINSTNFVARPLLENYHGDKALKVKRKILEGVQNSDAERCKVYPAGPRMSCPGRIPGLTVVDTLSDDGSRVVSRRVFAPIFQNNTHDFVDELDYSEVEFKASL